MNKAIVVYIDDNVKIIEEFSWLWKTWILWELYDEFDIVAYCNPSVIDKIPSHNNLIKKELEPLHKTNPFWKDYPFVNSFAMFNNNSELEWINSKYDYILKTDADVFLTQHIKGLNPTKTMIGYGGYMSAGPNEFDEVKSNLNRISKKLKLRDNGINSVGASIFGKTKIATAIIQDHYILTEYILKTEWKNGPGKWPGWFKGVSSMYAIHLVVNNILTPQLMTLYSMDSFCWNNEIDSNTYHIHAWHGPDFSKHKWFNGEYDKLESNKVPTIAKEYCQWIASNTIEELKNINK